MSGIARARQQAAAWAEMAIADSRGDALDELFLNGAPVAALQALPASLSGIDPLRLLEVTGADLTDISALRDCLGLRFGSLENVPLVDISSLAGLSSLRGLSLSGSAVRDLRPLAELTELDWLVLDDCPVQDLSPLTRLTGLTQLSVARTKVTDLTPLCEMTSLTRLTLSGSPVRDLAPIAGLSGLLADSPVSGLFLAGIAALSTDPELARAAAIPHTRLRTEAVLTWLRGRTA